MGRRHTTALSITITGDEPPSEFRIFASGANETKKGTFLFTEASAKSVMAEYVAHGIDLMLDYDHASLSLALDPAQAGKAAGWFQLAVRNGELWAVNVRWTEPAAEALRRKEWRFMSPAFHADDTGRVLSVTNVAITNLPATRNLEPLMAASITALGENGMSVEEFLKVCKALGVDMSSSLDDAMAKIKGEKPAEEKPAEDESAPVATADPEKPAAPAEDKPEEIAAALSAVHGLSGKKSFVASVADIRTWHASHVELATERKKLADREAILESAERRKLCVELVTLAGRSPATVWSDDKSTAPKAYLASMPIEAFREFVTDAIKASGGKRHVLKPPASADTTGEPGLTPEQAAICKQTGCDPAVFAKLTAQRDSVKTTGGV